MKRFLAMAAVGLIAASPPGPINIQKTIAQVAEKLKTRVRIPIELPVHISGTYAPHFYFIIETSSQNSYAVDIAGAPDCNGAHVCSFAHIYGSARTIQDPYNIKLFSNGWVLKNSLAANVSRPWSLGPDRKSFGGALLSITLHRCLSH